MISSSTRFGSGVPCTRYKNGSLWSSENFAAAMFAVIIICSMSCSASPETRGMMSIHTPFSSSTKRDSPLSKSIVPRAEEFAFRMSASAFAARRDSMTGAYFSRISGVAVPSRIVLTSLYTPRTFELIIVFLKS